MFKVVEAFLWREHIANVSDFINEAIESSLGGLFKMGFEFCKGHFYRVKVGAVGWQEQHPCPFILHDFLCFCALMRSPIIQYHNIA